MIIKDFTNTPEVRKLYSRMDDQELKIAEVTNDLSRDLFLDDKHGTIFDIVISLNNPHKIIDFTGREVGEIYYNDIADVLDFTGDYILSASTLLSSTLVPYNINNPSTIKKHQDSELWLFLKKNKKEENIVRIYYDKKIRQFMADKIIPSKIGPSLNELIHKILFMLNHKDVKPVCWS